MSLFEEEENVTIDFWMIKLAYIREIAELIKSQVGSTFTINSVTYKPLERCRALDS